MNKNVMELYDRVLGEVLSDFDIPKEILFCCNQEECVQARKILIRVLSDYMSDATIAKCTNLRRCTVCAMRNRYREGNEPWNVRRSVERIKNILLL